jgi:hypothetical protein
MHAGSEHSRIKNVNSTHVTGFVFELNFKIATTGASTPPVVKLSVGSEQERDDWVRAFNHNSKLLATLG